MKKLTFIVLMCCAYFTIAQTTINHTTNRSNTIGHITTIDNAATNGKADLILIVTQKFGVYNANEIGVWFNAGKWKIYNQNKKAMPANALFNVMIIPKNTGKAFVHTTSSSNISNHMTTLSSKLTDGKPNALVFVTQNFGKYNTSNVGVWYSAGKWKVYNENTKMRMPIGTKFNVLVLNKGANKVGNLSMNAFSYKNVSNGHVSTVKAPSQLSKSVTLFTTSNYGGVYNPNVTGVWLSGPNWTVYNQNKKPLPKNAKINVLALAQSINHVGKIKSKPAPRVYKKNLLLPGFSKAQNVSYVIEKNKAIYQGDIILGDPRNLKYQQPKPSPVKRKSDFFKNGAIRSATISLDYSNRSWLWYNGIVPYKIENGFSESEKRRMLQVIENLNRLTNLNIVGYNGVGNHIIVRKNTEMIAGGRSAIGRQKGFQVIELNANQASSVFMHELLHAIGIWHEQSRYDRDSYVKILWENVIEEAKHNFEKHIRDGLVLTTYDRKSLMHYGGFAFTKNDEPTIVNVSTDRPVSRSGLSPLDIKGINKLYPVDYKNMVTPPVNRKRTVTANILNIQSNDKDGGLKTAIDFYMECWIGPNSNMKRAHTGRNNFKTEVFEESDNNISPNWRFNLPIVSNKNIVNVHLVLKDEDGNQDDDIDINPFPDTTVLMLYIDTRNGNIYLMKNDGKQNENNFIGQVGEQLELEGFDGDIKAKINFRINID